MAGRRGFRRSRRGPEIRPALLRRGGFRLNIRRRFGPGVRSGGRVFGFCDVKIHPVRGKTGARLAAHGAINPELVASRFEARRDPDFYDFGAP